jgi:hypothetical protein
VAKVDDAIAAEATMVFGLVDSEEAPKSSS